MGTVKFADALQSCELLLEQNAFEQVARVLNLALARSQDLDLWRKTQRLLERIGHRIRLESLELAFLYAKALMFNDQLQGLLEFKTQTIGHHGMADAARVQLECAKSLLAFRRYPEARDMLEEIIPYLQGEFLGIAWGKLGLALFYLGKPWQAAFDQAAQSVSGIELGYLLFNQGALFDLNNQDIEARATWLKALAFLKSDSKMLAWTRYNLGMSTLRDLEPQAERHFLEAQRFSKNPKNSAARAAVLNGLATSRRMLGEWSRAEAAYREALRIAEDSQDRSHAYFGLARTLRLAGRTSEALEILEVALQDQSLDHDLIQVSRAAVFLALNHNSAARDALSRIGKLVSVSDQWLEKIARAETLRRDGQFERALKLLEALPHQTLHAREEARSFPELMLLLEAAAKPVPKALEYIQGITVQVVAQGVLSVRVNQRPINLSPIGHAGELLVYLLEQSGSASVDMMIEAMFSDVGIPDRDKVRGLIWKAVKNLRQALGWDNSIISLRSAYQLDPNATWQYDVKEARATRSFQGEFLKGVYSNWALEVARSLEYQTALKRPSSDLN
jgi:tetratricopeptide (TPR) repeat protein